MRSSSPASCSSPARCSSSAWRSSASGDDGGRRLRRTIVLALLVAFGALLVLTVQAPVRRAGKEAARGHRVFPVARHAVQGVEVALGERRFTARRSAGAWELDGRAASPRAAAALDDLVDGLVALRAVDVFRGRDAGSYGFDRPAGTLTLHTARGTRRVVLAGLNAAGSALYAQRDGDPRVLLVGTLLLTEIERVFYTRDGATAP